MARPRTTCMHDDRWLSMIPPAQPFPIAATSADVLVFAGACILRGWAFQESTDAAGAALEILDGPDTGGRLLVPITLAQNESTRDLWPGAGLGVRTGLFLNMVSGSVKGVLYVSPISYVDEGEIVFSEWA